MARTLLGASTGLTNKLPDVGCRASRRAIAERDVEVVSVYYLKRASNCSNRKKNRIANFETKICKPGRLMWA
mgnify:CR=1 FL=1